MNLYLVRINLENEFLPMWYGIFPGPVNELACRIDEIVDPSDIQYKKVDGGVFFKVESNEEWPIYLTPVFDDSTECSESIDEAINTERGWKWLYPRKT